MKRKHGLMAVGFLLILLGGIVAGSRWLIPPVDQPLVAGTTKAATTSSLFGGTPARNMVNTIDKNVPTSWNVEDGKHKNIKWLATLGSTSYAGPIIADGKVFVGTNNTNPRDEKVKGPRAVLMAFNEADGKFLWQIAHDIPIEETFKDALTQGLCSTPVIEGKNLYYVTPGCEVVCADTSGKIQWTYDMMKELKVVPHHLGNCSPLISGDLVMLLTSNGVNEEGKITSPKAPSFAAFHKKTGKLAWQSNLPGENIIEGQWSNPSLATVNGKTQVIFPGGDCVIYAMEPETGKVIWKCNCSPMPRKKKEDRETDNYIVATPVVVGDRLYVGLGQYPGNPQATRFSYFVCLDITRTGDVSLKNFEAKDPANKNSALVWAFGGLIEPRPEKGRHARFGSTISTAAVHDGLVYISEERGYFHCLNAKTGERYWDHDFKDSVWGSPYYVDGKIYVGTETGDVVIFEAGKTRKVLATMNMDEAVYSTPVVAGGVLYIMTRSKLYAIANGK